VPTPPNPVDAIAHALNDTLSAGPVLVGFSGGLDSSALLHALHARRTARLRAVHVHHGLHADADIWATHCQTFCAALGIELTVVRVNVDRTSGLGLEAAARNARYAAFAAHLQPGETLALAHHRDDQAETVLLRLLRGSGSDGLAAMTVQRAFASGVLWRPLLAIERAQLHDYAHAHRLQWIEDPSNAEHGPDRNFLRHRVLPLLRERWPHASQVLARSAGHLADAAALLREHTTQHLADVRGPDPHTLKVSALLHHDPRWRARVLRLWIEQLDLPPLPGDAPARIEAELLDARADAQPRYRWRDAAMQRWRDLLHAGSLRTSMPVDWSTLWDGRQPLVLPTGDRLILDGSAGYAFESPLQVHTRRGGERLRLPGRTHHHSLQHALQQHGVPPWQRTRLPLLSASDGELLAAGDRVISARMQEWLQQHGASLRWIEPAGT